MPQPSVKELLETLSHEEPSKQISIKQLVINHAEQSYYSHSLSSSAESQNLAQLLRESSFLEPELVVKKKWEALTTYLLDEKNEKKTFYGIIYDHLKSFFQPKSKASHRFHLFAYPTADWIKDCTRESFNSTREDYGFAAALIAAPFRIPTCILGTGLFVTKGIITAATRHPLSDEQQKETIRRVTELVNYDKDTKIQLIKRINTHYKKDTSSSTSSEFLSERLNKRDTVMNVDEKIKAIIDYMTTMEDGYFKNNGKCLYNIISEALEEIEKQEHRPPLRPYVG